MTSTQELTVWSQAEPTAIAVTATPQDIAKSACQLSKRDINSIAAAFESHSYEMVTTFVWSRASAALKRQLGSLGMEFVGEMLGRADITNDSDPLTEIGEIEAISLAEDLGMISTTDAMRLRHALELVSHFADPEIGESEQMFEDEAKSLLRTCVGSILGKPRVSPPVEFAQLRELLEERTLRMDDSEVMLLISSPYFFLRTTLSVLLSRLKTAEGAQLEHVAANSTILIPTMWNSLRKPEKWQVGQAYADASAHGNRIASTSLKRALISVQGFDFVPETLRSNTFSHAAHRVMEAHFAMNNFYNEAGPLETLSKLGTTIPKPAFPVCMTAILCVRLGNAYGVARAAQTAASNLLCQLAPDQWEYYLNQCLSWDKVVLEKIADDEKPRIRWIEMVSEFQLETINVEDRTVKQLLISDATRATAVKNVAKALRWNAAKLSAK